LVSSWLGEDLEFDTPVATHRVHSILVPRSSVFSLGFPWTGRRQRRHLTPIKSSTDKADSSG
jgi:hypothetical protein